MTREQALNRMAALCSRSEHCESEIRTKLLRAGMAESDIDAIVDTLYDGDYINNIRYCYAYARDQLRFAHWGRLKIAAALRQKRLPQADIDMAIRELDDEEYTAALDSVLAARLRSLSSDDDSYRRRMALMRHAASRGFTCDEVEKCLERLKT